MKFFLFLLFLSHNLYAAPLKMEMIFLSPKKIAQTIDLIDQYQKIKLSQLLTQNDYEKCIPMGEGCFHPQLGYLEKKDEGPKNEITIEERKFELKTFNALETNLINCEKNNYFDIFCGKESAQMVSATIEVWFDISSSLKSVDYNKDPEQCARRTFLEKISKVCKNKVSFSVFNTSLKQISDHGSVCMAYGTNDQAKLLRWLNDNKAKNLLIVTDIDEMSGDMREFLESHGAKMTGDGVKAFTATDLIDYADIFMNYCR